MNGRAANATAYMGMGHPRVGPTTACSLMEAARLVNDLLAGCEFRDPGRPEIDQRVLSDDLPVPVDGAAADHLPDRPALVLTVVAAVLDK
jgi:hypothetical protein